MGRRRGKEKQSTDGDLEGEKKLKEGNEGLNEGRKYQKPEQDN